MSQNFCWKQHPTASENIPDESEVEHLDHKTKTMSRNVQKCGGAAEAVNNLLWFYHRKKLLLYSMLSGSSKAIHLVGFNDLPSLTPCILFILAVNYVIQKYSFLMINRSFLSSHTQMKRKQVVPMISNLYSIYLVCNLLLLNINS